MPIERVKIRINGIVQGVGFRPFIYRTADLLKIDGFVLNSGDGVLCEAQGNSDNLKFFIETIQNNPPAISKIESLTLEKISVVNEKGFSILPSFENSSDTFVSPDIGICDNCRKDIDNSADRHYCYPFTNCTNCGPRFSIINNIPYDRTNTSMSSFKMCDECRSEYENPADRRFHAQPVACPSCGPTVSFITESNIFFDDCIDRCSEYINKGKIVAIKGIGGYHLSCNALNETAVSMLRKRKKRFEKPFAVMMDNIETVKKYCIVSQKEQLLLESPEKPIVLLKKKRICSVADSVAPNNTRLGVMLPYTPLHYLLMKKHKVLVMTSANVSDSPMLYKDGSSDYLLGSLSDAVLDHNRKIERRVDDSICILVNDIPRLIRRSRGFAPEQVKIKGNGKKILAYGAQQKNTFCIVKNDFAIVSGYIGDLDYREVYESYESELNSFSKLFDFKPQSVVCDIHPDYLSSLKANSSGYDKTEIQHHKAHFASALAEHSIYEENAIGFIFDGTGIDEKGVVRGGELIFGKIGNCHRIGGFRKFSLLGGEKAITEPWRNAVSLMSDVCSEKINYLYSQYSKDISLLFKAKSNNVNSPDTTSAGRIFDAFASIADVRDFTTYEGQAAVEFEQIADENISEGYWFDINISDEITLDWRYAVCQAVEDRLMGVSASVISSRFHNGLTDLICRCAKICREKYKTDIIVLSGGCFQNVLLSEKTETELIKLGCKVCSNILFPCNDGGISFGQAVSAAVME